MTWTVQTESTYDWKNENWIVPVAAVVSKVMAIGDQRISGGGGLRYYADSPDSSPEALAFRAFVTLLSPLTGFVYPVATACARLTMTIAAAYKAGPG